MARVYNNQITTQPIDTKDKVLITDLAQTVVNKNIDGGNASTESRIVLPKATLTSLQELPRKQGTISYDTASNSPVYDNGTALKHLKQPTIAVRAYNFSGPQVLSGVPISYNNVFDASGVISVVGVENGFTHDYWSGSAFYSVTGGYYRLSVQFTSQPYGQATADSLLYAFVANNVGSGDRPVGRCYAVTKETTAPTRLYASIDTVYYHPPALPEYYEDGEINYLYYMYVGWQTQPGNAAPFLDTSGTNYISIEKVGEP